MIDHSWKGKEIGKPVLPIEAGRLRFFANVIGDTDPIYFDEEAAKAAGYRSLPAPPTFLFAADIDSGSTFKVLDEMDIPLGRILHGEQVFEYLQPIVAGDTVTVTSKISDL